MLAPTGCLVGGTLVPTERGLVRLRSLGDPDGAQWQDLGIDVATDEGPRTATEFYVNGLEPVVTVDTARGYRIQGTPQHRVKVVDETTGAWEWKRLGRHRRRRPGAPGPRPAGRRAAGGAPAAAAGGLLDRRAPPAGSPADDRRAGRAGRLLHGRRLAARHAACASASSRRRLRRRRAPRAAGQGGLRRRGPRSRRSRATPRSPSTRSGSCCGGRRAASPSTPRRRATPARATRPTSPTPCCTATTREVYAGFLRGLFEADGTVTAGVPDPVDHLVLDWSRDVQALLLALGYPTTRSLGPTRTGWGQAPIAVLRLLNASYARRWADEIGFVGDRKNAAVTSSDATQTGRRRPRPGHPRAGRPAGSRRTTGCAQGAAAGAGPGPGVTAGSPTELLRAHRRRRARPPARRSSTTGWRRPSWATRSSPTTCRCPTTSPTWPTASSATTPSA